MQKLKPFHDFDRLAPDQLNTVHDSLVNSTFEKTRVLLRDHFQIQISYKRLHTYYHRWQHTVRLKEETGVAMSVTEFISLQNGDALPFSLVTQYLIQKFACQEAASGENTPAQLLTLQRIANYPFQCEIARERVELEKQKQELRQQQFKRQRDAKEPFGRLTEEEIDRNQAMFDLAFQGCRDPIPPKPSDANPSPDLPAPAASSNPKSFAANDVTSANDPSKFATPGEPSNNESTPQSSSVTDHSLEHRVNQYTLDRYHEAIRGKDPTKVGRAAAFAFRSRMQWCPCGEKLPCPDHGTFPPRFFEVCSDSCEYFDELRRKNLPYTAPNHLIAAQQER
jgi:hypothetical protein